jgi:hypothetical protein
MRNDRVKGQSHGFARAFRMVGNRHGAALAIVAISLVVILGMGALAVDMGMLIKQREDAQRAADAAALAGASAFMEALPNDAITPAKERAFDYLAKNYVGSTYIDVADQVSSVSGGNQYITRANEATVVVLPDEVKVRVIVRRPAVGTLFASLLGFLHVPIAAKAAAIAAQSGKSRCVMPFAMPDLWGEQTQDNYTNPPNRLEDDAPRKQDSELWTFDPEKGDTYRSYQDPEGFGDYTGLGSAYRNNFHSASNPNLYWNDYGREFKLKQGDHNNHGPSTFGLWRIPGTDPGDLDKQIAHCPVNVEIQLNVPYEKADLTGSHTGKVRDGITDLIGQDPDACWVDLPDPEHAGYMRGEVRKMQGGSCSAPHPGWQSGPRVVTAPLYDPSQIDEGQNNLTFNNLGVYFVEGYDGSAKTVRARFLFFAKGTGAGETQGSLIKQLKLVE